METSGKWHRIAFFAVCIVSAALAVVFYNSRSAVNNPPEQEQEVSHDTTQSPKEVNITTPESAPANVTTKRIVKSQRPSFPHCQIQEVVMEMLEEMIERRMKCFPGDECRFEEDPDSDPLKAGRHSGGMIVIYSAVLLLLVSLVAALLEVYRVRCCADAQNGRRIPGKPASPTAAPELSRRCSLADLTVLRHNRRESMMRRDSAMHLSVDHTSATSPNTAANHRVPLKLLETKDAC